MQEGCKDSGRILKRTRARGSSENQAHPNQKGEPVLEKGREPGSPGPAAGASASVAYTRSLAVACWLVKGSIRVASFGVRGHVRALELRDMSRSRKAATRRRAPKNARAPPHMTFHTGMKGFAQDVWTQP
jgi:hypothetical protein